MQIADKINLAVAVIAAFSTLMSLAVVIATFKILQANRETVAVMKEQMRSASRPYLQIRAWTRVGTTMMMLTVENSGSSAAHNLKLRMDKDFHSNANPEQSRNLRAYTAFVQPIESFPPKAELSFHLGLGHIILKNSTLCPQMFTVTAEYEFEKEKVVERTTVDLQPFQNSAMPIDPIAEQLQKLNEYAKASALKRRKV